MVIALPSFTTTPITGGASEVGGWVYRACRSSCYSHSAIRSILRDTSTLWLLAASIVLFEFNEKLQEWSISAPTHWLLQTTRYYRAGYLYRMPLYYLCSCAHKLLGIYVSIYSTVNGFDTLYRQDVASLLAIILIEQNDQRWAGTTHVCMR